MATNEYHFITRWRLQGTVAEIAQILGDPLALPAWWPSVYLEVRELKPGDENGLGREVDLYTKGWLPYTLRWQFTVTDVGAAGFALTARGDFDGRGIWTFVQNGAYVNVIYDWKLAAEKPLLRRFSFLMKPIFAANHRWAMAKGEESLRLELDRLRATTPEQRADIPLPPGPTRFRPGRVPLIGAAVAGVAGLLLVLRRRR